MKTIITILIISFLAACTKSSETIIPKPEYLLEWDVQEQSKVDYYVIETSVNGRDFYPEFTHVANDLPATTYSMFIKTTKKWFRIISVDKDKTESKSQIIKLPN